MAKNEHVHAICCRREVVYDVISCRNVNTIEGHSVVSFEGAALSENALKRQISEKLK